MEWLHGLFAMAPCGHLEGEAFQGLLAVFLYADWLEPSLLEVARLRSLVILVVVRHVDADIALPLADQPGQWAKSLGPQDLCHYFLLIWI